MGKGGPVGLPCKTLESGVEIVEGSDNVVAALFSFYKYNYYKNL